MLHNNGYVYIYVNMVNNIQQNKEIQFVLN
jgi:hypothetical protein